MKVRFEGIWWGWGERREGGWTEYWVRGVVRVGWMIRVRRRHMMDDVGFGNKMFSGCRMIFSLIDRENISRQCRHRRLMRTNVEESGRILSNLRLHDKCQLKR